MSNFLKNSAFGLLLGPSNTPNKNKHKKKEEIDNNKKIKENPLKKKLKVTTPLSKSIKTNKENGGKETNTFIISPLKCSPKNKQQWYNGIERLKAMAKNLSIVIVVIMFRYTHHSKYSKNSKVSIFSFIIAHF